jgi:phage terminase Nu1 subunit (DNA packaging protein)
MMLEQTVFTETIAKYLRLSSKRVRQLVSEGILHQAKDKKTGRPLRGRYYLQATVGDYIDYLRSKKASTDSGQSEYDKAKLRKMLADAERAELELKLFKNQLHTTAAVMFVWSSRIEASRKQLLIVPTRVAPLLVGLTDAKKIHSLINDEIESALRRASELRQEDFTKQNREWLKLRRSENGE